MTGNRVDVAFMQSLCSRFCHDLAAPIGALSLAVEMMEDGSKADNAETFALLGDTVKEACLRLELYRCLVGFSAAPQKPALSQIRVLLKSYTLKKKIQLQFRSEEERLGSQARILLALVLIAVESLPRGGTIDVLTEQTGKHIVKVQGVPCLWKKEYAAAVDDPMAVLSSETSLIFYLKYLTAQFEQSVQAIFHKDQELLLRIV